MADFEAQCNCGKRVRVNEFALGMRGRCPACGEIFVVDEHNAQPCEPPADSGGFSDAPSANENLCARCAKDFKGAWDRVDVGDRVLCHHCASLATDGVPARLQQPATPTREASPSSIAEPPVEENHLPFGIDPEARWFRLTLWALALGTIALTMWVLRTDTTPMQQSMRTADPEMTAEVPQWVAMAIAIWDIASACAGVWIALYMVLWWTGSLPHDVIWKDMLFLGWILLLLAIVVAVALGLLSAVHANTGMGPVAALLIFPLAVIIQYMIVDRFLDLRIFEYFLILVVSVLVGVLFSVFKVVVFGVFQLVSG